METNHGLAGPEVEPVRILVTGGAGFIGSHLADRLISQGHEVTILDTMFHAAHINPKADYWTFDCRDRWRLQKLIDKVKPEFIYHLAATVGVKRVLKDPAACMANNIDGLAAVLEHDIAGMFASTSEVYGMTRGPLREDSPLLLSSAPRWTYALSKLVGEHMALDAKWQCVRLFNVVGPRQNDSYGAVLPTFVRQALEGKPLTVYGDGTQVRTFTDVRDTAAILDDLRDKAFDVVNVSAGMTLTIRGLAGCVRNALGVHNPIEEIPYERAYPRGFEDCRERIPDTEKLEEIWSDIPYIPITLFDTIRSIAEHIKSKEQSCHTTQTIQPVPPPSRSTGTNTVTRSL